MFLSYISTYSGDIFRGNKDENVMFSADKTQIFAPSYLRIGPELEDTAKCKINRKKRRYRVF